MEFGDWEDSYNELPRWLQAIQESLPGTIVQYGVSPWMVYETLLFVYSNVCFGRSNRALKALIIANQLFRSTTYF